jgi:hypothetical protein
MARASPSTRWLLPNVAGGEDMAYLNSRASVNSRKARTHTAPAAASISKSITLPF